jgi:hypothetical protein
MTILDGIRKQALLDRAAAENTLDSAEAANEAIREGVGGRMLPLMGAGAAGGAGIGALVKAIGRKGSYGANAAIGAGAGLVGTSIASLLREGKRRNQLLEQEFGLQAKHIDEALYKTDRTRRRGGSAGALLGGIAGGGLGLLTKIEPGLGVIGGATAGNILGRHLAGKSSDLANDREQAIQYLMRRGQGQEA